MRMIEPHQLDRAKKAKPKAKKSLALILLALTIGVVYVTWPKKRSSSESSKPPEAVQSVTTPRSPIGEIKQFTADEFKQLYNHFAYPNTVEISTPPSITGNQDADNVIQKIATSRGYRLQSVAAIQPENYLGFGVQQKALQPLTDLVAEAKKAGHSLSVLAAFRSVDDQRQLFLGRLYQSGATVSGIGQELQNQLVEQILATTAPPGYSRHHSGFAVDFDCQSDPGYFINTACFGWLSKDNYSVAKKFGFIPSYPEGADLQGPEPEPWEYVWLGVEALSN
jgi:LAS superfamily LD-carboxypeptidase LdcB